MNALSHQIEAPYLYSKYLSTQVALLVFKSIKDVLPDVHVVRQGSQTQLFALVTGSDDEAFIERYIQVAQRIYGK